MRGARGASAGPALAAALLAVLVCAPAAQATFPGANGKIAFGTCGPVDCGIFTMSPDGSGVTQVTHNPNTSPYPGGGIYHEWDMEPAWSPDGKRIAFVRQHTQVSDEIFVVNADGSGLTQISTNSDSEESPTWAPDGQRIAFSRHAFNSTSRALVVMNADGTNEQQVTGSGYSSPDWSPAGDVIALSVVGGQTSHHREIHTIRPDGTGEIPVTTWAYPNLYYNNDPSWSPDASRLALARAGIPQPCCRYNADIFVMSADGSELVNLTSENGDVEDERPAWSPDGTKIVYQTKFAELRVMNPDGTEEIAIGTGQWPDWQPIVNQPPDCSDVTARPSSLRSADGDFRTVTLSGATDADGDPVSITIDGVTQDEPVGHRPDARRGHRPNTVRLRAERASRGDGRVYRIAFTASDGNDGECSGEATVEVRRKRNRPAVDSAPPSYDSFG